MATAFYELLDSLEAQTKILGAPLDPELVADSGSVSDAGVAACRQHRSEGSTARRNALRSVTGTPLASLSKIDL